MQIFISHIHEEGELAVAINAELKRSFGKQIEVFLAQEIPLGTNWLDSIREALQRADLVLALFSTNSSSRPWINIETGYGVMAGKRVVPLCHSGFRKGDLPVIYQLLQAAELTTGADVAKLLEDVAQRTAAQKLLVDREEAVARWISNLSSVCNRLLAREQDASSNRLHIFLGASVSSGGYKLVSAARTIVDRYLPYLFAEGAPRDQRDDKTKKMKALPKGVGAWLAEPDIRAASYVTSLLAKANATVSLEIDHYATKHLPDTCGVAIGLGFNSYTRKLGDLAYERSASV